MLIGTNLVQNEKWDEPIEYQQIYFEYPGDAELADYSKTKKVGDNRVDVTLAGSKWVGKTPKEDMLTKSESYQTPEQQQVIKTVFADALNKIQELYPEDVPELKLLQFASKGLNAQMQSDITATNRAVDKAKVRERMIRDYMNTKKVTRSVAEKKVDFFLAEDTEEAAA